MSKMYPQERLMKIMEIVRRDSKVSVDPLAEIFGVTAATIRSDLRELETRNLVTRTHGGALLTQSMEDGLRPDHDPAYEKRISKEADFKQSIGRAVATILQDGDSIILDDGSTTLQVARYLPTDIRIHVLTNGLNICLELLTHPNVEVIATGGSVNRIDYSYYGRLAEENVSRFVSNKAVLGASGLSLKHGVTTPNEEKSALKKAMVDQCHELIIVADHTKLERVTMVPVCPLDRVTTLVTDREAPEHLVDGYRQAGLQVIIA